MKIRQDFFDILYFAPVVVQCASDTTLAECVNVTSNYSRIIYVLGWVADLGPDPDLSF